MMHNIDLQEHAGKFGKLQSIIFRDIYINGMGLRILGINYMDVGPNWLIRKHRHTFFEFHYVTGNYTLTTIQDVEHKVEQGFFYLMPPGVYHSHKEESVPSHIGFSLRWEFVQDPVRDKRPGNTGSEIDRILELLNNAHSKPLRDDGTVIRAMLELLQLADRGSQFLQLQFAFLQVVFAIAAFYRDADVESAGSCRFLENGIVGNAIRFIEENYNQRIDVSDVASSVHLSYSHLSRYFRKYDGNTIKYHLNRIRLSNAQKLLKCSKMPIAQVATEVGFGSEQHFCASFRKAFGISPRCYRQGETKLTE